ncbi:MAG TPA: hypothetical protein V6D25_01585 [Leptolyngbyaceae cyanobacterium]
MSVIILCSSSPSSPQLPPSPPTWLLGCHRLCMAAICDRPHLHYTTITCKSVTRLNV